MVNHTFIQARIATGIPVLGALLLGAVTGCVGEISEPTDQTPAVSEEASEVGQVEDEFRHHRLFCGGHFGAECGDDKLCLPFMPRGCAGPRRVGLCVPKPHWCPQITNPVCGCDGETYGNYCEAARAGTTVEHRGACSETGEPVCGGVAGGECAGDGVCSDEPGDSCTPGPGRDCPGVCVCSGVGRCDPGMHWDSSATVCGCVPDTVGHDPCESVVCRGTDVCVAHPDGSATCEPAP